MNTTKVETKKITFGKLEENEERTHEIPTQMEQKRTAKEENWQNEIPKIAGKK